MIEINQLKVNIATLDIQPSEKGITGQIQPLEMERIQEGILKFLRIEKSKLLYFTVIRKSMDARKKDAIFYTYTVLVSVKEEKRVLAKGKGKGMVQVPNPTEKHSQMEIMKTSYQGKHRPIIVGTGPAGLFCALTLAEKGWNPLLIEQGSDVDTRIKRVEKFWLSGELNLDTNVQFGEGGAGTFSDGKLNTAVKDTYGRNKKVLDTFILHGAPSEIGYLSKPHIGTDRLRGVIKSMREKIISLGGEVRFDCKLTDILIEEGVVKECSVVDKTTSVIEKIPCETLILATGHSARDMFSLLQERGVEMSAKPFAIGVRVEHSQEMIGLAQYGNAYKQLPAAAYKLTYQASSKRGVYSFCMCPGGFVVNSSSEEGLLVVNGMSNYHRDEVNANSAMIVTVTPDDFKQEVGQDIPKALQGMEFQRKWERLAFQSAQGKIPVQQFRDFEQNIVSKGFGEVLPNMKGEYQCSNLRDCLPLYVSEAIVEGMHSFDRKMKGFANEDTLLSGVETRTSSPIRIHRDEQLESSTKGLFPCGEGAGYAGGIMSAAIDGIKVAEAILQRFGANNENMKR